MAKKLPNVIYVKREQDGDMSYLLADESMEPIVNADEATIIGQYRLTEMWEASLVLKASAHKLSKK